MKLFQKLLISSVVTTFIVPVLAQDTLKITVTGTRSPKPVDAFPGTIDVIEKDELSIKIVSKDFTNISTLERHKSIMKLFSDLLQSGELHAISLDLKAPSEL